jgi:hypothetical protein
MILNAIKTAALVYSIAAIIGFCTALLMKLMYAALKIRKKPRSSQAVLSEGVPANQGQGV